MKKICIIGGGIIGMTSAYFLHKVGYDITIVDRNTAPGRMTSNSNAMQLCYGTIAPWAGVSDIKKYAKYLLKSDFDAPVYVRQPFSMRFLKFLMVSGWTALPDNARRARQDLYELADQSRLSMETFVRHHPDLDFHYKKTGKMRLYESRAAFGDEGAAVAYMNEKYGMGVEILDSAETYLLEPALRHKGQKIFCSTYSPIDASGDAGLLCLLLRQYMEGQGRFEYIGEFDIQKIDIHAGMVSSIHTVGKTVSADYFVMAAGAASVDLLADINIDLPMVPIKGYSFTLENPPFEFKSCISDISRKFAFNTYGDHHKYMRLSGLMDFVGQDTSLNAERLKYLKNQMTETFPALDLSTAKVRAGLRPVTGHSVPVVGETKYPNLWVNTGQGVYGWTLAMGSAERLKNLIQNAV